MGAEVVREIEVRGPAWRERYEGDCPATRAASGRRGALDPHEVMLADLLAYCLDEMDRGRTDFAAVLARCPEAAAEIDPLLGVALLLCERKKRLRNAVAATV